MKKLKIRNHLKNLFFNNKKQHKHLQEAFAEAMNESYEVKNHLTEMFREQSRHTLESYIKYEFPKIKNLEVLDGEGTNFLIQFDEGNYTKKEVEDKIIEIREASKNYSHSKSTS